MEREWEFTTVKTLTVDDQKRIRIPDAKPRQVFAYANNGDGTLTLTLVKAEASEAFPRGSLLKYFTPEEIKRNLQCSLVAPWTTNEIPWLDSVRRQIGFALQPPWSCDFGAATGYSRKAA